MQLYKLFPRSHLSRRLSKFAATELKIDTGKQDLADSVLKFFDNIHLQNDHHPLKPLAQLLEPYYILELVQNTSLMHGHWHALKVC